MSRPGRPGWTALPFAGKRGSKGRAYRHDASGWIVRHCGHPTALWPYWASDPSFPEHVTMTHNGKGWTLLELAMTAIEAVLEGRARTTDARCVPGVRRVCYPSEEDRP